MERQVFGLRISQIHLKICAFGIKASRWVTMHGLALNVNTDLKYFDYIVPCGISDKGVTSIEDILNKNITTKVVKEKLYENFARLFNAESILN